MNFLAVKQAKLVRVKQILDENKEEVVSGTFGHTHVNRILRSEFGSGTKVRFITEMTNEIRHNNPLVSRVCDYCHRELPIIDFRWSRTLQRRCSDCRNVQDRQYYQKTCERRRERRKSVYWSDPEPTRRRVRVQSSIYDEVKKIQVISHYGKGVGACVVCGEDDLNCLSIDHINGGGREHRKRIGSHFYAWLIKNGFPEGYQTLCMNCQFKKRVREREYAGVIEDNFLEELI
jgi:hypothetical protein